MRLKDKILAKKIARERIIKLLNLAEKNLEMNRRYVELAKRIAQKYNVRIPKEYKKRICKKCGRIIPKQDLIVRVFHKEPYYVCKFCGNKWRIYKLK